MKFINVCIYLVYLIVLISILLFATKPMDVVAQAIPEVIHYNYQLGDKIPEFVIDEIISRYATGTKAYQMKKTLFCESHYWNVQSNVVNKYGRERSYGIAQIHLPSNPSVTQAQALDIEYAIKWMSDNFYTTTWYGYNRAKDICN